MCEDGSGDDEVQSCLVMQDVLSVPPPTASGRVAADDGMESRGMQLHAHIKPPRSMNAIRLVWDALLHDRWSRWPRHFVENVFEL